MKNRELREEYKKIETKYAQIIKMLEESKYEKSYAGLYKGITTLKSPLVYKPKVLFIGANEGEGRYREINKHRKELKLTPLRMIGEDESCFEKNNWFEIGNARGGYDKPKGKHERRWIKYEWYQRDKKINNPFISNVIELLYNMAELMFSERCLNETDIDNIVPFWYEEMSKYIMVTNLYPISTNTIGDLNKICTSLSKEKELIEFWDKEFHNKKRVTQWDVKRFFIRRTNDLVNLLQPQVIVCMGSTPFSDFTYGKKKIGKKKVFEFEHTIHNKTYPVVGFSRSGSWLGLMPEVAERIVKNIE